MLIGGHCALLAASRVLSCPALSLREGYPNPQCRRLGSSVAHAGWHVGTRQWSSPAWPRARELTYLGLGRVMAWERASLRFDVFSFAARGLRDPRLAEGFAEKGVVRREQAPAGL